MAISFELTADQRAIRDSIAKIMASFDDAYWLKCDDEAAFPVAFRDAVAAGVMVIDIVMPDMDGIELLGWIAANRRDSKVILISGYGKQYLDTARKLAEASGLNVPATLVKPFGIAEVEEVLDRIRPGA